MSRPAAPDVETVLELLAGFGERAPRSAGDELGSLELTWLIAQFEDRYAIVVDLDDAELARIRTVGQAAEALRQVLCLAGPEHAGPSPEDAAPADSVSGRPEEA